MRSPKVAKSGQTANPNKTNFKTRINKGTICKHNKKKLIYLIKIYQFFLFSQSSVHCNCMIIFRKNKLITKVIVN